MVTLDRSNKHTFTGTEVTKQYGYVANLTVNFSCRIGGQHTAGNKCESRSAYSARKHYNSRQGDKSV